MSYTIEVYAATSRRSATSGYFALYVMFYPQLVAGPIERPQNLLHQFPRRRHRASTSTRDVVAGLRLMLWGLFKKVVDRRPPAPLAVDPSTTTRRSTRAGR